MVSFPMFSLQFKVVYYANKLGIDRSVDSFVAYNHFNYKNQLSVGAEELGEVRAHLITMEYLTFFGIKMHINSPNIFKHTLFLSLLSTFLKQQNFKTKLVK